MKITFKEKDNIANVEFEKTHPTIINSIRRTIIDDVETFAISNIEFRENSTIFFEEVLANRIGLIPLVSKKKGFIRKDKDPAGELGSKKSVVKLNLKKNGKTNVYSSDLESSNKDIVPAYKNIIIAKMYKDSDVLDFEAEAILGSGKEHTKWAPAHSYIKEDNNKISLVIETFGQMSNKDVYNEAVDINLNKIDELGRLL